MIVLDASAVLAFLKTEPGHDVVEHAMNEGAVCGAANWSEVMQKTRAAGRDWKAAGELLESYDLTVEPVTRADAEWAATCWQEHPALSLADRLCLALAHRLGVPALTADAAWGSGEDIRQIRS